MQTRYVHQRARFRKVLERGLVEDACRFSGTASIRLRVSYNLRRLRYEMGWSQGEVEEASGIPRNRVSRWETAETSPEYESLEKLAKGFGVDVAQFFAPVVGVV